MRKTMIREWRLYRGLTQQQLADRIDVSTASMSRIENGKQDYTQAHLEAIAYALNCEPADLIGSRKPGAPEFELWTVIQGMKPSQQMRAMKVLRALAEEDEAA
jgi:transcriptional regulator with XRE-family HTH domain